MFEAFLNKKYTNTEQSILEYLLKSSHSIESMSLRTLASTVHVAPSTIVSFCKKCGFNNYGELKNYMQQQARFAESETSESFSDFAQNITKGVFPPETEHLVSELAKTIKSHHLIYCTGDGSSGIIAEYAARKLAELGILGIPVRENYAPILFAGSLNQDQKNLVLVFSNSGETDGLNKTISLVKNSHPEIEIIAIAGEKSSTLGKHADTIIHYYSKKNMSFGFDVTSQLMPMIVIDYLVYCLNQTNI